MESDVPLWMPTQFTAPLTEDLVSDGPKLRRFVELFWKSKETKPGETFTLDPWQAWLIDRILERYPDDWPVVELRGRLRYEQCVVSLGRQNGKTVLAAILSLYGLMMHVQGPTVLGLAESVAQAGLVYNTAKYVIDNTKLANRFVSTGTRGIRSLDGTRNYRVAPGKADALQGITISLCLYDEVHLTPDDMWTAVSLGTSAIEDGLVLGITTAGDDESVLLKRLYESGEKAWTGQPGYERFGFFLWEAPDGADIDDPAAIMAANPAVACGRKDLQKTINAVRLMPEHQARQFVHNRFVASSGAWLPPYLWNRLPEGQLEGSPTVVAVDRSPSWEWATITVAGKDTAGICSELVGRLEAPDVTRLADACTALARKHRVTFVMAVSLLGDLAAELRRRGLTVETYSAGQVASACATAYSLIAQQKVIHDHAAIVNHQVGRGIRKNVGDSWRIVRPNTNVSIDALMATVLGIYAAETIPERGPLIF